MHRILIVDDDEQLNRFITRSLARQGFDCTSATSVQAALDWLKREPFDALVCDFKMDDGDGLDVLKASAQLERAPPFIMITAYGSVQVAVDAMKYGAADFLEKPVSVDELKACVQAAISRRKESDNAPAVDARKGKGPTVDRSTKLIGSQRWLGPFLPLLQRIANTHSHVLLDGETGTGKSEVAREICRRSKRASAPFVELNCGALAEHLVERELFGNAKGAFTGADDDHEGKVAQANRGTLFLDEIGEMPLALQPKLLHLLSERRYQPLGSAESRTADVRFIAATNRDLEKAVAEGRFREDLYYRLQVVTLTIPPLRQRTDDIPLLLEHFRHVVAGRVGYPCPDFSEEAVQQLMRHEWPGNVRELANLVEKLAIIVGPDEIVQKHHLPAPYQRSARTPNESTGAPSVRSSDDAGQSSAPQLPEAENMDLKEAVNSYERALIIDALRQEAGNRTKAAKRLNLKRTTLIEKIGRLSIESDEYESNGAGDNAH